MSAADVLTALAAVCSAAAGWLMMTQGTRRRRLAALSASISSVSRRPEGTGRGARSGGSPYEPRRSRVRSLPAFGSRSLERRRRRAVRELCFALAAELRAGRTPAGALSRAVEVLPEEFDGELAGAEAAAGTGGDAPAALRYASERRGAEGLRRLAACWQVGSGSGAGFALAVERLAGALRAEEEHRQDVAAQLAGTRATSRLLASLPLVGLVMSTAMGVRPLHFLLGSPYGLACLVLGGALDAAGVLWTRSLARSAEEGG